MFLEIVAVFHNFVGVNCSLLGAPAGSCCSGFLRMTELAIPARGSGGLLSRLFWNRMSVFMLLVQGLGERLAGGEDGLIFRECGSHRGNAFKRRLRRGLGDGVRRFRLGRSGLLRIALILRDRLAGKKNGLISRRRARRGAGRGFGRAGKSRFGRTIRGPIGVAVSIAVGAPITAFSAFTAIAAATTPAATSTPASAIAG